MSSFEILDAAMNDLLEKFSGWFGERSENLSEPPWPGYDVVEASLCAHHGWTVADYYQELHNRNVAWENS